MVFRSNAAESGRPARALAKASLVSYACVGTLVALMESGLIVLGSIMGQAVYAWASGKVSSGLDTAAGVGLLASVIYIYLAYQTRLYQLAVLAHPVRHLRRIARTALFALAALSVVMFLLKLSIELSRGATILFAGMVLTLCVLARFSVAGTVRSLVSRDAIAGRPAFVLGEPSELAHLPASYLLHQFGIREVGRYPLALKGQGSADIRPEVFDEALSLSRTSDARDFVVVAKWDSASHLAQIEQGLRLSPLRVLLLPNHVYRSAAARNTSNDTIAARLVELQRAPMSLVERAAKRAMDTSISLFALAVIAPLLICTSLAIKMDSAGPVVFRQRRNGFNQKKFVIYKFRTMSVLEDGNRVVQAQRHDDRITRVGRFLRRTSIDELPQLFNVLRGEMSLVGPRPHALAHDHEYTELIDDYCMRHHVKPGITGWAQVNGFRGETPRREQMQKRVELDLWYINNRSLLLDLRILFRTCTEVLKHDAY